MAHATRDCAQSSFAKNRTSRRQVLLGAGAAALSASSMTRALATPPAPHTFSRIFPYLPPFAPPSVGVIEALNDIGRPGGIMDAKDPLSAGPIALILDPALRVNNPDAAMPHGVAGTTFLGQFVDHDMTFDTSSVLGRPTSPRKTVNERDPALDLDSVYGGGPAKSPQLYQPDDLAKFRIDTSGHFEDFARGDDNKAKIVDPRNDEHVVIAGIHLAIQSFHNVVVDHIRAGGEADDVGAFWKARRQVTWHYQWIVLHEMLPSFIGQPLVRDILWGHGKRVYKHGGNPRMPVEFQGAAYRFGHSIVRPSYRINMAGNHGQPFFGFIFDPASEGLADPDDMRGGARAERRFIGWQTFFDFGDGEVKPRKIIDTRISSPLFNLPLHAIASGAPPTSLAQRNLLRQLTWSQPSGQHVAATMGEPRLSAGDLGELAGYGVGLERRTPLWYYILKEAFVMTGGQTLGPVGGRIVGEVIIGLIQSDKKSWLSPQSRWRPTLPSRHGRGEFDMVDLLTLARVDPGSRGQ